MSSTSEDVSLVFAFLVFSKQPVTPMTFIGLVTQHTIILFGCTSKVSIVFIFYVSTPFVCFVKVPLLSSMIINYFFHLVLTYSCCWR